MYGFPQNPFAAQACEQAVHNLCSSMGAQQVIAIAARYSPQGVTGAQIAHMQRRGSGIQGNGNHEQFLNNDRIRNPFTEVIDVQLSQPSLEEREKNLKEREEKLKEAWIALDQRQRSVSAVAEQLKILTGGLAHAFGAFDRNSEKGKDKK